MVKGIGKFKGMLLALPILLVLMCGSGFAEVSVYAEGAYTADELKVYIYADITTEAIVSFGVKLTYDADQLTAGDDCLERNDAVWYFGDPDGETHELSSAAGPTVTTAVAGSGELSSVVFVGGKIDSREGATQGVAVDDRVLLGIVTFSREGSTYEITDKLNPFSIGLELGKEDSYANFVEVSGNILDATSGFSIGDVTIRERGDVNGDGSINGLDYRNIRQLIGTDGWPIYADGNGDGDLNGLDYRWLRQNI